MFIYLRKDIICPRQYVHQYLRHDDYRGISPFFLLFDTIRCKDIKIRQEKCYQSISRTCAADNDAIYNLLPRSHNEQHTPQLKSIVYF